MIGYEFLINFQQFLQNSPDLITSNECHSLRAKRENNNSKVKTNNCKNNAMK